MINDFPYFEPADVAGFTTVELDAVADLLSTPGWAAVKKYLGAIMEPVRPAVYTNTDPARQFLLHQGLGAIYVASNLVEFVSSAKSKADLLVQQEVSAREAAEQAKQDEV
jgi:hypothetical protein